VGRSITFLVPVTSCLIEEGVEIGRRVRSLLDFFVFSSPPPPPPSSSSSPSSLTSPPSSPSSSLHGRMRK